ncbi:MAG: CoA-binding protein [Ghiorsea sp.]
MPSHNAWFNPDEPQLKSILQDAKHIAIVGCSPKPDRTSYQIAAYLIAHGYNVYPVHPKAETILGQKVYASLAEIPQSIDIVNVFRKPEFTPPIAEAAVATQAKVLWLQQGIMNEQAWQIMHDQGLRCVMDRCIAVTHKLLLR